MTEFTKEQIAAVCEGDQVQGQRFVQAFSPVLLWQIGQLCPSQIRARGGDAMREWSEDRLQDFYLFVFEKQRLQRYDPTRGSLQSYLRYIARNFVRSCLRAELPKLRSTDYALGPDPTDLSDAAQQTDPEPPSESWDDPEFWQRLQARAKEVLSSPAYELFMRLCQDPPVLLGDLAKEMGIGASTLYKRRSRLLAELREIIAGLNRGSIK